MAKTVEESIKRIREAYELGTSTRASAPGRGKYGKKAVVMLGDGQGYGPAEAYRARQFASSFSKSDVERLCDLRCSNGRSLTWGHITKILKVPSKQERWSLLKLAAKHNLSARALEEEVNRRFPNKRGWGGGNYRLSIVSICRTTR